MTPSLLGRIQTRLFVLVVVGIPWTIVAVPFIPRPVPIGEVYAAGFTALFFVALFGCLLWDPLYHLIQQYRWEKDWPTMFGLLTGINEGLLVYFVLLATGLLGTGFFPFFTFSVLFGSTWILLWLTTNGPMRVLFLRWRFRGGKIV